MKRVLVTRPLSQNAALVEALRQRGDSPLIFPLLDIEAFNESKHSLACEIIENQVQNLATFDYLIFISTNAVEAGWAWIDRYWPQLPEGQHWFAIGEATATALHRHDVVVQETGVAMNSEALLQQPLLQQLEGKKILIFRGKGGRELLRDVLQQRGATVEYCEVYQRLPVKHSPGELADMLDSGIDMMTVTSGETLHLLLEEAANDGIKTDIQQLRSPTPTSRHIFPDPAA